MAMLMVAVLAACSGAPHPAVGPSPTTARASAKRGAEMSVVVAGDTMMHRDTAARVPRKTPAIDSASVSAADVSKSVAEVFGDSAVRPAQLQPDADASGPSWDIDVR